MGCMGVRVGVRVRSFFGARLFRLWGSWRILFCGARGGIPGFPLCVGTAVGV